MSGSFCADDGRSSCSVRLTVALHYLKYASGMSDEAVLDEWLENPYRQYFTGEIYFEHEYPTDQSTMSRWRKKLARNGAEKMLEESLKTGLREGFVKKSDQFRRARKAKKQLKTFLGRVLRDMKRKMTAPDMELQKLLELGERLFNQKKSGNRNQGGFGDFGKSELDRRSGSVSGKSLRLAYSEIRFAASVKNPWI